MLTDILDGRYLNALMHTDYAKKYFAFNASGSGQRYALSAETLNSFPVPVIPLQKQKQIGELFSALDKKIELNKQINQNLRASRAQSQTQFELCRGAAVNAGLRTKSVRKEFSLPILDHSSEEEVTGLVA
jgi:restriction endonuclease S subunit